VFFLSEITSGSVGKRVTLGSVIGSKTHFDSIIKPLEDLDHGDSKVPSPTQIESFCRSLFDSGLQDLLRS